MDVHLEVPEELARQLASDAVALARVALEALAAGGVRSGAIGLSSTCTGRHSVALRNGRAS
jgi:hypothetical protein